MQGYKPSCDQKVNLSLYKNRLEHMLLLGTYEGRLGIKDPKDMMNVLLAK
jgi:hypothetical protein